MNKDARLIGGMPVVDLRVPEIGRQTVRHDLHVATYNHFEGAVDRDGMDGKLLGRLDRQLDLLASLDLDVLISTEAAGWFDQGDTAALELAYSRLGMLPLRVRAPRHDCNL